jgi:hypothetical protein
MPSVEVLEDCLDTAIQFKFDLSQRELDRIDLWGTPIIDDSIISLAIQDRFLDYSKGSFRGPASPFYFCAPSAPSTFVVTCCSHELWLRSACSTSLPEHRGALQPPLSHR